MLEKLGFAARLWGGQRKVILLSNPEAWSFYHMLLKCTDSDVRASRAFEVTQTNSYSCAVIPAGTFAAFQGWGAHYLLNDHAVDRQLSILSLLGSCGDRARVRAQI